MSIYKKRITKLGERYWCGNRLISLAKMSPSVAQIVQALPDGGTYDDSPEAATPIKPPGRECIFCGQDGRRRRFVHLQMVYLCEDDYHNKTIGEVGQRVKELRYAEEKEAQKT